MEFPGFLGNEQLKQSLSQALRQGRTAHFYLLSGPSGSGKRTLSRLLAAALLCRDPNRQPCGSCPQCRKALSWQHPDLITVDDTEHKTVPVDVVRRARDDLFIRPNEGRYKIYYVPRAQDLGLPGQNALLKVLEEPPSYGVFLLLTDNPDKLLPTVRSRCRELRLQPLSPEQLQQALCQAFPEASPEALTAAASRSGGWLGQAKALLESGGQLLPQSESFASAYAAGNTLELARVLIPMEKLKRDACSSILTQWRQLLMEALASRSGLGRRDAPGPHAGGRTHLRYADQRYFRSDGRAGGLQGNASPGAVCGHLLWMLSSHSI